MTGRGRVVGLCLDLYHEGYYLPTSHLDFIGLLSRPLKKEKKKGKIPIRPMQSYTYKHTYTHTHKSHYYMITCMQIH